VCVRERDLDHIAKRYVEDSFFSEKRLALKGGYKKIIEGSMRERLTLPVHRKLNTRAF